MAFNKGIRGIIMKILSVDRRSCPSADGGHDIIVVLVEGAIGDYAAYEGIGSDEYVARSGHKLGFARANLHFCGGLDPEKYRA